MSTVDEVLAAAEVVDAVCVIDGETRIISVPTEYKELGVESDEKVTRVKFQCPKIVGDNIDLTEYNLYINYRNAANKLNSYLVEDVAVTGDTINFSWLLSRHVTESPGTISYIVCAKKSDDTGVINEWNTKVATGIVGIGLEATEEIEEQNIDAIEQILRSIVELENNIGGGGSGGYYAPAVDAAGNLSWTASKADMPAVDGANIKGPQGVSGVYVGSGDMPDGYNVQIDPDGTPSDIIPSIDETLTAHGKAADAKATGDAIRLLSEEIAAIPSVGVISVKDFGAIGDGVTDDTAALQLAFDSTADQGGNLYIPEGDYKITGRLTIADPICVSGDGCLKLYDPDSSAEFAALTVNNGVRLSGLKLEAQEGFAGVILKYYPTSNTIYPSETRFKSLNIQSISTQKILSYFDVYGGNNYGLIIEDVTIGKPNTARYCQYGMRILTEGGYAGAGASWENSGTVRNLRIDTRGDHQLYAVGASGGVVPKNWVFENIAIQANSKLQSGNAFTYQDSFYLYRFAEVTLRNCKVWDASAAAYADGRAPVVYEDIIATTYIDGCAPAFYLDSGAVVLSTATTPEITAYRQQYAYNVLKEIAEKFDISGMTISKTETDSETTLTFSDGTNTKSIAVSKVQMTDEQISAAIGSWMDANAVPTEVWSKNVLNVNDENVSMGYIAAAGQINSSDTYWVSGYIPAKQGDVLRSSLDGATANFYYVAEYDSAKGFLTRAAQSANTYTVTNGSTAYIRVSWKTSLVSYKNEKAMLTLNNADLSFEAYGSHMEGGLGEYLILTSPNGTKYSLSVSDDAVLSAVPV